MTGILGAISKRALLRILQVYAALRLDDYVHSSLLGSALLRCTLRYLPRKSSHIRNRYHQPLQTNFTLEGSLEKVVCSSPGNLKASDATKRALLSPTGTSLRASSNLKRFAAS